VQGLEDGQEGREGIWLVRVRRSSAFIQERDTQIEIREGECGQGFDENVDHNIGVVEVRVELVARETVSGRT
jgi:hypothetical protein